MKYAMKAILSLCIWFGVVVCAAKKPNIVFILTDDQDILLGSVTPVKQVQTLVANKGATFTNAFVSTPICCPSRSSILTGRYLHNHKTTNNSFSGGCSSVNWQQTLEPRTFGRLLQSAGYRTFYAGKYLNAYGYKEAGGTAHVPVGWDWWLGLEGNSRYYDYTLSINGTARHFSDQYLTNVIQNYSVKFLETVAHSSDSFLMVLAPPAPHAPYTPEPKYRGKYEGVKVPRTPSFNTQKLKSRHWLVNMAPAPLPADVVARVDSYQARRWETLLSVDDMVAATVNTLQQIGQLDNTYIIYTSDHGYHLGQYALPWDKRQPYETDIRVPMFVRGPGIPAKSLVDSVVVNIDIAPTIVDMAGLPVPADMDGKSFLQESMSTQRLPPHRSFVLEYEGEGDKNTVSTDCPLNNDNTLSECYPSSACKCQDSRNNTYNCIRQIYQESNTLLCCFHEQPGVFWEYYDLNTDPYQLNNTYNSLSLPERTQLQSTLKHLTTCRGSSCHH
ncbi:N-acetylglucosamine-6-sulfatase-like [Homalodisca vitripennis]|nr:N-acetylglucosamine-6-sulfatase-like [Homalodisca vitripennis]XP_046681957.1 N-acetylglucosamine-6-sulfatase-like [Homalodisca vitripennis]XP_046681958.1 N-acetylglucosamine-6-sulfatase-like [Homalodisca vitripennis]XP_046681960.1 N-acetylglucosamine-6-sulfatase-like [Homalodisca vitripennis]